MTKLEQQGDVERQRVLIVDDALVVRQAVRNLIEATSDLEVIDAVSDGRLALRVAARAALARRPVDLVLLDIEMPTLDGLAALPELLEIDPPPRVIMLSGLTQRGAVASLRALAAGASDYICKPSALSDLESRSFSKQLLEKLRVQSTPHRNSLIPAYSSLRAHELKADYSDGIDDVPPVAARSGGAGAPNDIRKRTMYIRQPRKSPLEPNVVERLGSRIGNRVAAIAIGGSTGGPQALTQIFSALRDHFLPPVFVTQHMPPAFTTILAEQLSTNIGRPCHEVGTERVVHAGEVYLAAGDYHLVVKRINGQVVACASREPPENFCRPAVDPMLRSIATCFGRNTLAVVLTGMGQDGTKGCAAVREAGGAILAQDEASSVVWGMPGSVVRCGGADAVLPLNQIAPVLLALIRGN